MEVLTCPIDGRPLSNNATICPGCTESLDRALGDVDWLMEELDTTLTRQTKTRPTRGSVSADGKPMPYNVRASETGREFRDLLKSWVSLVAEGLATEGRFVSLPTPATAQTLSSWMLHHTGWLSRHDAGPDAYTEIVGAVNNIRRTIDIAPDQTYAGPCYATHEGVECTDTLWSLDGGATAKCRTCGTVWDAQARTLETLTHADKIAQTAAVMTVSFTERGVALTTDRIKQWVRYGHLTASGTSQRGRPTYIVAHVARLVTLYNAGQKLTNWNTEQETPA